MLKEHMVQFMLKIFLTAKLLAVFIAEASFVCVCCQVDAIEYYSAKERDLLEELRKEAELAPQHRLGIAFVTLQTEAMAK